MCFKGVQRWAWDVPVDIAMVYVRKTIQHRHGWGDEGGKHQNVGKKGNDNGKLKPLYF